MRIATFTQSHGGKAIDVRDLTDEEHARLVEVLGSMARLGVDRVAVLELPPVRHDLPEWWHE